MTDKNNFKIAALRAGLTLKDVSNQLGITYAGLCKKLNNQSQFKSSEMEKLYAIMKMPSQATFNSIFFPDIVDFKSTYDSDSS